MYGEASKAHVVQGPGAVGDVERVYGLCVCGSGGSLEYLNTLLSTPLLPPRHQVFDITRQWLCEEDL